MYDLLLVALAFLSIGAAQFLKKSGDKLYWDEAAGSLKRGAQGKGPGTPRRLVRFMRQFRRTYDPPAMKAAQLVDSLPPEFDRWKEPSKPSVPPARPP